jgi:hypothetical protein
MSETERKRVTEAELKRLWFSDQATGMIHDHQTGEKVVVMEDGTEYATPFADLAAPASAGDSGGDEIGGDECGDLLPGDERLPLSLGAEDPSMYADIPGPSGGERG